MRRTKATPVACEWNAGERVTVHFDEVPYGGVIVSVNAKVRIAVVRFDDDESEQEINFDNLAAEIVPSPDEAPPEGESGDDSEEDDDSPVTAEDDGDVSFNPPPKGSRGMHHYPVVWDRAAIHFNVWAAPDDTDIQVSNRGDSLIERLRGRQVHFYGTWSKTSFSAKKGDAASVAGYAIWMWARVPKTTGEGFDEYTVESLRYEGGPKNIDPRTDMHSLNSDICAAIRKWFFFELRGDSMTITELRRRAERPTIKVPSLRWLDTLLIKMKEIRDTAMYSGGERHVVMETGNPDEPIVSLKIDFSELALSIARSDNPGKIPNLEYGVMLEGAIASGGKRGAPRVGPLVATPNPENVKAMKDRIAALNARAKAGDMGAKKEARKLRAALREMGHAGGTRG